MIHWLEMKYLLQLLTLICCQTIQGVFEWTVIGKVTDYGQNVTLFCNVSNCCPKNAGWDRYSPEQRTLFIDLKTAQPNKKYDGKVKSNGYTLIIQNLTKQDLNVSYSCIYGATLGCIKILLEDDVFTYEIQPSIPNDNSRLSGDKIAGIIFGVLVLVVAFLFIVKILWRYRKRRKKGHRKRYHNDKISTDEEKPFTDWMNMEERETYKTAIQDGEEERQHVRIQVIGKNGVGKTSLVRTLLGKPFKENLESTDGIDIVRECQIRKTNGEWIIGEDKTKSARIRRIIQAVKMHQKHEKEKEPVSACSDQPHAFDGYSSETDRIEPAQEPTQSHEKTFETESVDGIADNKDKSISTDNIYSVSKSDSDKHEAYSIDTEQSIETPADLNDTEQSMEPPADLNDTEQSMQTIAYSVESPVIVNSEMTDQTTKQIIETMTGNMNEIIKKAKREKENMTSENLVECDFWDFAGQKEYYATHQTFCSQHSIYIIVADINEEIKDTQPDEHFNHIGDYIGFWLDSIHFLCTDLREGKLLCPPVIMVFTGIDKVTVEKITESNEEYRSKFLNNFGRQRKADHIRYIRFISNKNPCKEDIDCLKSDITQIAEELEYFVEKRPTRWINLEYALEVMKGLENTVPVFSFEDIHKLADKNSIHGKELLLFLNYQHKIGNIVFFDDIHEYIILQPNWLVSCFKCLICDDEKRDKSVMTEMYNLKHKAQLSDTLIDGLFQKVPDLKFRDHKGHILKVMEKFDIIVKPQFKNTNTTYHNSYYMPCMIESFDITLTNIMNQLHVCDHDRTPWLVFEFIFFPIAYYNHILVSYIRKYKVCIVGDNSPAIYEGKAVLYLDDTEERLLIICFSRNAISLQIWKWRKVDDLIYQQIVDELRDEVSQLEKMYSVNISYEIKAKCNTGDYSTNSDRKTYEYINKQCEGGTYRCIEHADYHSKKEIENTWFKHDIRDMTILTKLTQLNRDDFQDLVALGTFSSYENRVFLAGPCNIGKSSLASILIDEAIPKTWYSTDGIVINFGRNGIDLQHRKMIPLKKGSGDILTKLLLGNPELKEQKRLPIESQIEQNVDENKDEVPGDAKSNLTTNESKLNPSNMDKFPPKQQRQKTKATTRMTSSGRNKKIPPKTFQKTLKGLQKQPIHTAHSIQDDLLEKIKKGTYIMKIAPTDLVDLGGHKSFDMTHQLFIQHRGTFILMFDGRLGLYTELAEYPQGDVTAASILVHWINSILTFCTKRDDKMPRIVFAATHSDSFSEDEKKKLVVTFQEELTQMFSSHKLHEHILYDKVFFINATDKADVEIGHLKDKLVDIAFQQSTWGQQMPIVWVPLDLQISDMRTDGVKLITKEKLLEMNKYNEEFALSERRVEDFLLVQHSIGKLLYFNEPALKDFIVIQPSAMVNILRAFITDRMFWPENGPIRDILENLSSTGVLTKTDLFTLWLQPAFKDILMNNRIQDYVVQVLLHLDILVEPKHYAGKDLVADLYLVPCIVASKFPPKMQNAATDDRTICIAYHLKETVVPSALSFKLIGAAISIWPLKVVDGRFCLYYQAAVMDTDTRNELHINVKGQRIVAYLVNDMSKHLISPDLATTIQECLTLALGRILKFYGHCFGRQNHHVTSELFEIEVGEVCKGETCLIPLSDAKTKAHWRCNNGKIHKTKCPLNWVVDKNKKQCDSNCKGLETETQLLTPDDQHFVQLARTIGIGDFYNFFIELGMEKADYDNLNFCYFSNPMDFMLMGLFEWRDKTESDQSTATFGKLQKALTAIERQHNLCQIHREDHTLVEQAHSCLQDVPSDDVINALTEKNLIGDCVVHLGVELCLSIGDIRKTLYNFPRDLNGQVHDLLTKWKNCNETKMVKPTIYRLMVALKHIKAAKGLSFVKKTYGVE